VEFGDKTLRELLIEAIRDGDRPEVRAELRRVIDGALDRDHLRELLRQRALGAEGLDTTKVAEVREEMERAAAQRLQPHFVRSFFIEAFRRLGGEISQREPGRYEVVHVPASVRANAGDRGLRLVLPRYERVAFDKDLISLAGFPLAEFLAPGHPLLDATIDCVLETFGGLLRRGGTLVDRHDPGTEPRVMLFLEHSVTDQRPTLDGRQHRASQRLQFVELDHDGNVVSAGQAPFLDYDPLLPDEGALVQPMLQDRRWLSAGEIEDRVVAYAIQHTARVHLDDVKGRVDERVARTAVAVKERLGHEINYWSHRADELERREMAGQLPKLNSRRARDRAAELTERLQRRLLELDQERHLTSLLPVVVGGAVIIPKGMIEKADGIIADGGDPTARRQIIEGVLAAERASGREPEDVSGTRQGYDIISRSPGARPLRFIKVVDQPERPFAMLSRNEALACLNADGAYWLAVAARDGEGPRWVLPRIEPDVAFAQGSVEVRIE
jgi:hypothetical protein